MANPGRGQPRGRQGIAGCRMDSAGGSGEARAGEVDGASVLAVVECVTHIGARYV